MLRRNHLLNVYMGFLLEVNNVLLSCAIQLTCYGFIKRVNVINKGATYLPQ